MVVLAWQDEPYLGACLDAAQASDGVAVELVLVDNGARAGDVESALAGRSGVQVLRPGENTGFAGGCNLGVAASTAPWVALVNSDCIVAPDTLAALVVEAQRPRVGPVMASVRYASEPDVINSAGNPVHLLGVSWAGRIGEVEERTSAYDVTSASGACLLLRRALWDLVGGFDPAYFAYHEDAELSLRLLRLGLQPRCVPDALALHHYEFARNPTKLYLMERNRLMLLATTWSARSLLLLAPLLLGLELGITAQSVAQGWGRQKVRGWWWLVRHRSHLVQRRRVLRAEAVVDDGVWMGALTARLDPQVIGSPTATRWVNALVVSYWGLVRRLV